MPRYVSRELVVQFNADVADGMPWKFTPTQREVSMITFLVLYLALYFYACLILLVYVGKG